MIKVAHAADIHIRGARYQDEVDFTFNEFYKALDEEPYDLIVLCGDIFHSKLTVSNEYFDIAFKFFAALKERAPVVVIPGNHDLALNNKERMDSITPVVNALNGTGKHPLKYSKYIESFEMENIPFVFHHLSILNKKSEWKKGADLDKTKINIALYHGSINGITFDNGWISRGNKDDIDIFDGFDFAMLGDIHISQCLRDNTVVYPGSLRQNSYGESVDKGFVKWEIEDKDNFSVERVLLPQKRYFFTLYGSSVEEIQEIGDLQEDSRVRVQLTKEVDFVEQLKIKSEVEKLYKPCNEVLIIPPAVMSDFSSIQLGESDILHENIREPSVQKELIREFFKNLDEDTLKKISELDKVYHSHINTDVERNIVYEIKTMEWKNMFSYGDKNKIDFSKLSGLIGLIGENGSGKSSIVDILSIALTNQIHKEGAVKNVDFINRKTKKAEVKLSILMNGNTFKINKTLEKKVGKNGESCLADVDFKEVKGKNFISHNGETKPDTNNNIRNKFGDYEDLVYTSICHQFGLTSFIDDRATKRKEILGKYFDLDIFSTKFKLAKDDYDQIKFELTKLDYNKISAEIDEKKDELDSLNREVKNFSKEKSELLSLLVEKEEEVRNILPQLGDSKYKKNDYEKNLERKSQKEQEITKTREMIFELEKSIIDTENFGFESINEVKDKLRSHEDSLKKLEKEKYSIDNNLSFLRTSSELLKTIPNVPQCKVCPLAKNAFDADDKIVSLLQKLKDIEVSIKEHKEELQERNYQQLIHDWQKSEDSKKIKPIYEENLKKSLSRLEEIEKELENIEFSKQDIEKTSKIQSELSDREVELKEIKRVLDDINAALIKSSSKISVLEYQINVLGDDLEKSKKLNDKKYIYDFYLKAMGKDGISYWIISKKMPIINNAVNNILSQVVDFRLLIEDVEEEKKVKIYILDAKGKRPIELASGMEKTIASISLRAVLWKMCMLPKMPILFLDESFSHLDSEKYDGIIKLLVYLKSYFKAIFIITHDDGLKASMDDSYYVSKNSKGMSFLKV